MKKRIANLILLIALLGSLFTAPVSAEENTITIYNWGQYISDGTDGSLDVIKEFTARTGIKVNYVTFDSNETLYTKLKTGGSSYDLIIPSDYMVARLIADDMLEPLDFANIPNYKNIDESFRNTAYDPENVYSVPYTWGTTGLIYNTKYVTEPVSSWDLMWNEKYSGKILMFDNSRDAFGIAQLMLGHDLNTENQADFEAEAALLQKQKPLVQQYVMDQIFEKMEREEAWIAPYYAGDYLTMAEENPALAFCMPDEGFNLFIDAMCIPKSATNKAGAEAFINFICDPEISGQNLDYLGYSTPISAAKEFMDPEVALSEIAYPPAEVLARGSSFLDLPTDAIQRRDALWLDVKTSGTNTTMYIIIAAAAVVVIAGLFVFLGVRKKKKKARRGRSAQS